MSVDKKDLAEEYAEKEYKRVNGDSEPIFTDETCFTFEDIKYAFNAGRDSVVEGYQLLFEESPYGVLVAVATLFDKRYHVYKPSSMEEPRYTFALEYEKPTQWYDTVEEAMGAANNDYRERVKQALGL